MNKEVISFWIMNSENQKSSALPHCCLLFTIEPATLLAAAAVCSWWRTVHLTVSKYTISLLRVSTAGIF